MNGHSTSPNMPLKNPSLTYEEGLGSMIASWAKLFSFWVTVIDTGHIP